MAEPSSHRHGSRHKPHSHRGDFKDGASLVDRLDDMNIDPHHHSTQSGHRGKQGVSRHTNSIDLDNRVTETWSHDQRGKHHHEESMSSGIHTTQNRNDDKRKSYRKVTFASDAQVIESGHHSKERTHHRKDDVASDPYVTQGDHHRKRRTHQHADDMDSNHHSTTTGNHSKPAKHHHTNDIPSELPATSTGHRSKRGTHHHKDDTASELPAPHGKHRSERGPGMSHRTGGIDSGHRSTQIGTHGTRDKHHHKDDTGSDLRSTDSRHHHKGDKHRYADHVASDPHATQSKHVRFPTRSHPKEDMITDLPSPHSEHHHHEHHHVDDEDAQYKRDQRKRLTRQALEPYSEGTGTPYPCSQKDIEFHRHNVFHRVNKGPFTTVKEATTELMWQNDARRTSPPAEQAAIDRLSQAAKKAQNGMILGPDFVIKAFADLDLVFFGGRLRGNVTVKWAESSTFVEPRRTRGHCRHPHLGEDGQCRIELNADIILGQAWTEISPNPSERMIGTLFHEMCHAYKNVRCNKEPEESHGKFFGTRIGVVDKQARRLVGLWASPNGENRHQQWHFFLPDCEQSPDERDGENYERFGGGREGESGKLKPRHDSGMVDNGGRHNSSSKRGSGRSYNDGEKSGGSSITGGARIMPERGHKGSDCVVM